MGKRKFTDSEEGQIRKIYEAGFSLRDIGKKYKCVPDTIKAAILRAGGKTRKRILLSPQEDEVLRKRYEQGESTVALSKEFGHTDRTIARSIRRAGGHIRPVHERYKKFPPKKRCEIARQYKKGKTGEELADRYDCCAEVVYNAVEEQGWKVRSTGEAREIPHSIRGNIEGKICRECHEWQPLTSFHRAARNSDGLRHRCKECARGLTSEWRENNPIKYRAGKYKRRAQEKAVFEGNVDTRAVFDSYGGRCAYCNATGGELTVDHIVPLSRGGAHSRENIAPACRSCNSSKADIALIKWLARGGPPAWQDYA